jgi:erythromycin esterase-like protein
MGLQGEVNVGQLCRQRWGMGDVYNVGFSTHTGTVAAASEWGQPVDIKPVNPSLPGSYERIFHDTGLPRLMVIFDESPQLRLALEESRIERAIGVIYLPRTERVSHYFQASLPNQFDAMIHIDDTIAVEPLEAVAPFVPAEAETFPTGV